MMQLVADRGGLPRFVLTFARSKGMTMAMDRAIESLQWDDINSFADPNSLKTTHKIAQVHPPNWEEGVSSPSVAAPPQHVCPWHPNVPHKLIAAALIRGYVKHD